MPNETPDYRSYLLRLWRTDHGGHATWRAALEDPYTGVRRGFASLEQLFAYLMEQTEDQPGHEARPTAPEDKTPGAGSNPC